MNLKIKLAVFIFLGVSATHSWAQDTTSVAGDSTREVLRMDYNVINNDSVLQDFYRKLDEVKSGKRDKVTVLHVGDSHIQGDYFSGAIRTGLQEIFGNAGRGLVFPYSLAKTYAPADLSSSSDISWVPKRNFFHEDSIPLGVSGYAIVCNNDAFQLRMGLKPGSTGNEFDRVCVLHGNDSTCYSLGVYRDDAGSLREMGVIDCFDTTMGAWSQHTVNLDTRVNEFVLKPVKTGDKQYQSRIYGFILENSEDKGILYHTAGVGASQLVNFTRTSLFVEQSAALQPDLVIFSLGTNESYNHWFDTAAYQRLIEKVVGDLRAKSPGTAFLFTTPPDIVYKYQYPRYMDAVCRTIRRASLPAGFAVWDLNYVMGGRGSMKQWHASGLAQNDHIHFKSGGYQLQGKMFIDALMYSYNTFTENPIDASYLSDYIEEHKPMYRPELKAPPVQGTAKKGSGKYHTVRSGETLYSISRKYGTTVAKICKLNGISAKKVIRPGQRLRVR